MVSIVPPMSIVSELTVRLPVVPDLPSVVPLSVTVSTPVCPLMETLPTPPLASVRDSDRASSMAPRFAIRVVTALVALMSIVATDEVPGVPLL